MAEFEPEGEAPRKRGLAFLMVQADEKGWNEAEVVKMIETISAK